MASFFRQHHYHHNNHNHDHYHHDHSHHYHNHDPLYEMKRHTTLVDRRGKYIILMFAFTSSTCLFYPASASMKVNESQRTDQNTIMAAINSSAILDCDVTSPAGKVYLEHIISWSKDNIQVPIFMKFEGLPPHVDPRFKGRVKLNSTTKNKASLKIDGVKLEDEGWYDCSVVFLDGKNQRKTQNTTSTYLCVTSQPMISSETPNVLIKKTGEDLLISCHVTGHPSPSVYWTKNGRTILNHAAHGEKIQNKIGGEHGKNLSSFKQQQSLRSSSPSSSPSLSPEVHHQSSHYIGDERMVIRDESLIISRLHASDTSSYACIATNIVSSTFKYFKVFVEGNAHVINPPRNSTVPEGGSITLTCSAEAHPTNITYSWFKDDVEIRYLPDQARRVSLFSDGRISLSDLKRCDTGWYQCRADNGVGSPQEVPPAFLNVTYLPSIISVFPHELWAARGTTRVLRCRGDGNPPPHTIVWFKNDRKFDPSVHLDQQTSKRDEPPNERATSQHSARTLFLSKISKSSRPDHTPPEKLGKSRHRIYQNSDGSLYFDPVLAHDEGNYSCAPYSSLGAGKTSHPFYLRVAEAPHFSIRPPPFVQVKPRHTYVIPCKVTTHLPHTIHWRKIGSPMTSQNGGNLTLRDVSQHDEGHYECVASSSLCEIITSTEVVVEVSGHGATEVTIVTSSTSAAIFWRPAYYEGHSVHYTVWYRKGGLEERRQEDGNIENEKQQDYHDVYDDDDDDDDDDDTYEDNSSSTDYYSEGREDRSDAPVSTQAARIDIKNHWSVVEVPGNVSTFSAVVVGPLNPDTHYTFFVLSRSLDSSNSEHQSRQVVAKTLENEHSSNEETNNVIKEKHFPASDGLSLSSAFESYKLPPPRNVTIRPIGNSLLISWEHRPHDSWNVSLTSSSSSWKNKLHPAQSTDTPSPTTTRHRPSSFHYFHLQYRTMNHWVDLASRLQEVTSYEWRTPSRGALYYFRVSCCLGHVCSEPSQPVTYDTRDPIKNTDTSTDRYLYILIGSTLGAFMFLIFLMILIRALKLKLDRRKQGAMQSANCHFQLGYTKNFRTLLTDIN